jgi:hypothetical protein
LTASGIATVNPRQRVEFKQGPDKKGPKVIALQLLGEPVVKVPTGSHSGERATPCSRPSLGQRERDLGTGRDELGQREEVGPLPPELPPATDTNAAQNYAIDLIAANIVMPTDYERALL